MSLDGIRLIKKKPIKTRTENVHNSETGFWGVDSLSPRPQAKFAPSFPKPAPEKNIVKKSVNWNFDSFCTDLKIHIFNRKAILVGFVTIMMVVLSVFSVYSYNLISNGYDFLKLFNSGRYLVLFQNNTEMRATGGFIGSYAIVNMKNGVPENYFFETDVHKLDDAFNKLEIITPPNGLRSLIHTWVMEDSNWAVDFPEAAQKINWFYEHEKEVVAKSNPTNEELIKRLEQSGRIDGVIAINATVMSDLLKIVGPVTLNEYNTTINSDNFLEITQYQVEREYWQNPINRVINNPKSILKDMIPKTIKQISERKKYNEVIDLIQKELREKQIIFYFYDDHKEKIALINGWAGEIKQTDGDYLYVVNSNTSANKSSLNVKEDIKLNASIDTDGTVIDQLTVTRTHSGDGVWPDGDNNNYMRILVPYGAEIISAKLDEVNCVNDVQVTKEAGKYVFALFVNTLPRSSRILTISYKLPTNISKNEYTLYVQKQPGNLGDNLEVLVDGKIKFDGILNIDRMIK